MIMSKILGFFKGFNYLEYAFIGILLVIFAIIIIPGAKTIAEKFGIETTDTLKVKLETQKNETEKAVDANETLVKKAEIKDEINKETIKAVADIAKVEKEVKKRVTAKIVEKDKQIKEQQLTQEKVSEAQINFLWEMHCEASNSTTGECSTQKG